MLLRVTDPEDPRIAAYRHIRERDLVGRQGCFIAEGEVVLRLLLQSPRHQTLSLLVDEKRLSSLGPLLAKAGSAPVYAASQSVLDAIAGFHLHRGILALGRTEDAQDVEARLAQLPPRALVLCLFGIGNHDNMGGIFRNAAAFGADAVLLDAGCCDPLYRKAIRVSVGAALTVPFSRFRPGEDALAVLAAHGFESLALSPRGVIDLSRLARPERAAVILGAEGPGLDEALMARATTVRIPMAGGFDSLNVATTSGIVLHHLITRGAEARN